MKHHSLIFIVFAILALAGVNLIFYGPSNPAGGTCKPANGEQPEAAQAGTSQQTQNSTCQKSNTQKADTIKSSSPTLASLSGNNSSGSSSNRQPDNRNTAPKKQVFESQLAGKWYPADKEQLQNQIKNLLESAETQERKEVRALVLPHAGYKYSGSVAASSLKQLSSKTYHRVIILGPTHRYNLKNKVSVPANYTHYKTPLGEIPLDMDFLNNLAKSPTVEKTDYIHRSEHSVQIELPLLQEVLTSEFELVPVVVGQLDPAAAAGIGKKIRDLIAGDKEKTLIVVSSDFTHYGPRYGYQPFDKNIRENIRELDMKVLRHLRQQKIDKYYDFIDSTKVTVCGKHPLGILLQILPSNTAIHKAAYDTSGRMTGSFQNSVSYLGLVCTAPYKDTQSDKENNSDQESDDKSKADSEKDSKPPEQQALNTESREKLLTLARRSIKYYLEHRTAPSQNDLDMEISEPLKKTRGAFVTLHKNGRLRGCIGEIKARRALYKAVIHQAVNAAFRDRRFRPLKENELDNISIEISVLYPPHKVSSFKDIEIGRHGIILKKRGRSSVYLPHVASQQSWDIRETLRHLSRKAGLPADAWKENTDFYVFEATVFSEDGS